MQGIDVGKLYFVTIAAGRGVVLVKHNGRLAAPCFIVEEDALRFIQVGGLAADV